MPLRCWALPMMQRMRSASSTRELSGMNVAIGQGYSKVACAQTMYS